MYSSIQKAERCLANVYGLRSRALLGGCLLHALRTLPSVWLRGVLGCGLAWQQQLSNSPWVYCAVSSGSSSRARYMQFSLSTVQGLCLVCAGILSPSAAACVLGSPPIGLLFGAS